jgi:molecular chaperone GrpE (heat shock protein)
MLYKCAILGLVVLLVGGYAYWQVYDQTRSDREQVQAAGVKYSLGPEEYIEKYGRWYTLTPEQQNQLMLELNKDQEGKNQEQLAAEQKARLRADRDKLAAGAMDPGDIADYLYGRGWKEEVERYKKSKEQVEIAQTISVVCLSIGGTVFGLCTVIGIVGLFLRVIRALRRRRTPPPSEPEPKVPELTDLESHVSTDIPDSPPEERPRQKRRVLSLSDAPADASPSSSEPHEPAGVDQILTAALTRQPQGDRPYSLGQPAPEESAVGVLLTDTQGQEKDWSMADEWSAEVALGVISEESRPEPSAAAEATATVAAPETQVSAVENTLSEQVESLQKQIAEFKQEAQNAPQTPNHAEPLHSTLKELAQQVSAIRDYAASQQDRVEKLQDGYDWGIIRAFGLKVIRCLDNLESRVNRLPDDDGAIQHLEEIRDELLFALESSGIEQFRPELNSEYRGQEKVAETIKERQPSQNPDQAGKIAKVIRPGYRYMIDDENYKIVRTAQVKLFG